MTINWLPRRRGAGGTRRAPPCARLRLECLEDRSVPATLDVTTTLDVFDASDGKRSLREAITQANNAPGADVIVVPVGVYKIALAGAGDNGNLTGDFDITDAVTIRGAAAGLSIIDGQQLDRVFDMFGTAPGSIAVVLEKLTVRNGSVTGHGGGVQVVDANLVVRDSAVNGNRASQTGGGVSNGSSVGTGDVRVVRTTVARNIAGTGGGGIAFTAGVASSMLTVNYSTIRRNVSGQLGGGINADKLTLTNSTVNGNTAASGGGITALGTATLTRSTVSGNSGGGGGGISANTVMLSECTVSGNVATDGGSGGGIDAGTATLIRCTVSGNSAESQGGGVFTFTTATLIGCTVSGNRSDNIGGGVSTIFTATLSGCTVSGNSADLNAGGISAQTATLTNCTVSGNSAATNGGGIHALTATLSGCTVSGNTAGSHGGGLFASTANLLNCTVVENYAHTGGGVFRNNGTFNVRNTIIALNLVDFTGTGPDLSGAFTSGGHNLIGDVTGGSGFSDGVNGDFVGTVANPIDPKVGALKDNGGRTKTHALKAGSRAIDAGDNASVPATDQRGVGFPRKKDGNFNGVAIVDIGAFER